MAEGGGRSKSEARVLKGGVVVAMESLETIPILGDMGSCPSLLNIQILDVKCGCIRRHINYNF